MPSRKPFLAANWKMNLPPDGAFEKNSAYLPQKNVDVVVFPTVLDLRACIAAGIVTGAQHGEIHPEGYGAHTGDVSMQMLKDLGCTHVLCGHSERRLYHGETNQDVMNQVVVALEVGLHPIVCVGETEEEREDGREKEIIQAQLCLLPLDEDITIAYEPVWAIGTGKTATPAQAEEIHALIRSLLPTERREATRILYGGSVDAKNIGALLGQQNIDGALIGGASRKPDEFQRMIEIAANG